MDFNETSLLKWVTAVVLLISFLTIFIQKKFEYWQNRGIPYLQPKFPYGNFDQFWGTKKSIGVYSWEFYNKFKTMGVKYGGIYCLTSPIFMPVDPECVKNVLIKDFSSFHARGFYHNERDQPILTNMFTVDGIKWRTLRYKFSPAFSSAKLKYALNTLVDCVAPLLEYISNLAISKKTVNIKDLASRYTTNTIASCAFGIDCNCFEDSTLHDFVHHIVYTSTKFLRLALLNTFPKLCRFLRIKLMVDEVDYFADIIEETIEHRKKNNINRKDFLQIMIDMQAKMNNEEFDVSLQEIQAQSYIFFLAGHETSSTLLTYFFFEVGQNKEIQEKIRDEVVEVFRKYGKRSYGALNEMKYLQCVIDETLRKYPPIPIVNRKAVEDYTLTNGELLPKDSNVLISILGLHRDPEYFPNPDLFDPERFSEENKDKIPPGAYIPFGDGPRNCVGYKFAMLQAKVALSHLIARFRFSLNKNVNPKAEYTSHYTLTLSQDVLLDVEEL